MCGAWAAASKVFHIRIWNPDATEWIRWSAGLLIILVGFAALIILRQPAGRLVPALATVSVTTALCWVAFHAEPWSAYFALQEWSTRQEARSKVIDIEFDKSRVGTKPSEIPPGNPIEIVIPVRIFGIPEGLKIEEYRSAFSLKAGNDIWNSGLLDSWAIHGLDKPEPWLVLQVDPDFYQKNGRSPLQLAVDCTFTLIRFAHPQLKVANGIADVNGYGQCRSVQTPTGASLTTCLSPAYQLQIGDNTLRTTLPAWPFIPSFDALYVSNELFDWTSPDFRQIAVETRFAKIRRQFLVSNLKLSDYKVDVPGHTGGPIFF